MSKQINQKELAEIVSKLLTDQATIESQLDEESKFAAFMTDIASVVAGHCGGEVLSHAAFLDDEYYVGVVASESLPDDGGIWADCDPDGELL